MFIPFIISLPRRHLYLAHANFLAGVVTAGVWYALTKSLPFPRYASTLELELTTALGSRAYSLFNTATYIATVYQIFTHILTGVKYLGVKKRWLPIPWATRDEQTLTEFTVHNGIDIGNLVCMMLCGAHTDVYHWLLAFHFSSSCMAFSNFDYFQRQIILDAYSPLYVRVFKTAFVFIDPLLRAYALYTRRPPLFVWVSTSSFHYTT